MMESTQQHPTIGTSSPVTIGLVITLLGVAFVAGGAHIRLGIQSDEVAALKAKADKASDASQDVVLRVQRVEDAVEAINKTLNSIDRKLDRALNRAKEER